MTDYNLKKQQVLGMPYGTACNRLRKLILFKCIQELGKETCRFSKRI